MSGAPCWPTLNLYHEQEISLCCFKALGSWALFPPVNTGKVLTFKMKI